MDTPNLSRWTPKDAAELYGIQAWGNPYFSVSPEGEVQVELKHNGTGPTRAVSLMEIAKGMQERGIGMPVLLRFSNILDSRIQILNDSFKKAIAVTQYRGSYRGVYPIKVNQQQQVVDEVTRFGAKYHHGLEAGSKAELIAALAHMHDPEGFIVCNGYKDAEFIDLALQALRMGIQTLLVVEMPTEVALIRERAELLKVKPNIGVRVKLSAKGSGMWMESGGDQSVFGLNCGQIVGMLDELRECGMLDCLRMLHYHLGSQIPNIQTIRSGASEAARIYADLVKEGAAMGILDIGGGLAVDYDGTQTNFASSTNYTIEEYCTDVVEAVAKECDDAGVPHPLIISESGRATVAHFGVLLFNVLDTARFEPKQLPDNLPADAHEFTRNLLELAQSPLSVRSVQECFNDALFYRDEIRTLFLTGSVTLRERGMAEQLFNYVVSRVYVQARELKRLPPSMVDLEHKLADIYYSNFSLFQSLPDSWAIDQLFPIMPIHRLNEQPDRNGIFSDLTCDCDGKIDRFIDIRGERRTLPLHALKDNEEYLIGVFLVGAYQETLGDLHNLFGDTNVVGVQLGPNGEVQFSHEVDGDSVSDVLSYVEYDPKNLVARYRGLVERAVHEGRINLSERRVFMDAYENGMRGYTYFEK